MVVRVLRAVFFFYFARFCENCTHLPCCRAHVSKYFFSSRWILRSWVHRAGNSSCQAGWIRSSMVLSAYFALKLKAQGVASFRSLSAQSDSSHENVHPLEVLRHLWARFSYTLDHYRRARSREIPLKSYINTIWYQASGCERIPTKVILDGSETKHVTG